MKLTKYLETQTISKSDFSKNIDVSSGMLSQWLSGHRPVSPEKCVAIEKATQGQVTRKDLRPDDWMNIWPELVDAA